MILLRQRNAERWLTTELRFVIPPACRPISARPLASSTLFTPQLGAMFPLQRMWTFILHTAEGEKRRQNECGKKSPTWWFGAAALVQGPTFALQPLLDDPPQQRPAVVAEGGRLVVVDAELVWEVDAEARARRLQREKQFCRDYWRVTLWNSNLITSVTTLFQMPSALEWTEWKCEYILQFELLPLTVCPLNTTSTFHRTNSSTEKKNFFLVKYFRKVINCSQ